MSLPKTINSLVLNDLFVYTVDISIFNGVCYCVIVCKVPCLKTLCSTLYLFCHGIHL